MARDTPLSARYNRLLLLVAASLTAVIWVSLLFFRGGYWRVRDDSRPLGTPPERKVCAVIPARNEASTIRRTVASLAAQSWPAKLEVIVVDDHSGDGTADAARLAGATVIQAPPLPPGWTGKMWAVNNGVRHAMTYSPDYLLLTDADIEHAPDSLAALASRAEAWHLDLASFMVKLRTGNFAEKLLIPAFVFFFLKLYPPRWISDPTSRVAGAAGGCILVRASALQRIGGIEAIRDQLIDDCALARKVKSGGRIWMGLTASTHSIRPYSGFGEIRAMIARTAFTQLNHSALALAGTVAGMALIYLAGPVLVFSGKPLAALLGGSAWLMMMAAYAPMLRFYRQSAGWALLLPAVAVFYVAATFESALRYWTGKGGQWKGRAQDTR